MVKKGKQSTEPTAEDMADWEELSPEEFKFEKAGAFIQGILLDAKETSLGGMSYTLQAGKKMWYFFGGKQIDGLLPAKIGYEVKVTFKGISEVATQPGYNPMKIFSVQYRKAKVEAISEKGNPFEK